MDYLQIPLRPQCIPCTPTPTSRCSMVGSWSQEYFIECRPQDRLREQERKSLDGDGRGRDQLGNGRMASGQRVGQQQNQLWMGMEGQWSGREWCSGIVSALICQQCNILLFTQLQFGPMPTCPIHPYRSCNLAALLAKFHLFILRSFRLTQ